MELLLKRAGLLTAWDTLWKANSTSISCSPVFLKGILNFCWPDMFLIARGMCLSCKRLDSRCGSCGFMLFMQISLGIWTCPASNISSLWIWVTFFLSFRKSFMLPLNLCFKKSSKLSLTPNYSSAYVSKPILIIDSMSTLLFALGDLTTMMKSYSAFGPSLSVIRLVSSFDTGFSMYQASCLISLFTITAPFLSLASDSRLKGKLGLSNFCFIWSFL